MLLGGSCSAGWTHDLSSDDCAIIRKGLGVGVRDT